MSSDFYFRKWRNTLACLEEIVNSDNHYQIINVHDKKRCEATLRLSAVLSQYMAVYNDIMECVNQNLQIQKTAYMMHVVTAVVSRILELKSSIRKLEFSNCQFFGHGLVQRHLTPPDAEMLELPTKVKRSAYIDALIEESFEQVKKRKEALEQQDEEEVIDVTTEKVRNWWDIEDSSESIIEVSEKSLDDQVSEETLRKRGLITLIQAHEKSRQVIKWVRHCNYKRNLWIKELSGSAPLLAPYNMRVKAAEFIQKILRAYFELKRKKAIDCKRDEILGLKQCEKQSTEVLNNTKKLNEYNAIRLKELECEYNEMYDKRKLIYFKRNGNSITEEWRDFIREWFKKWFDEIRYFRDIPKQKEGGMALIIKEELPSPNDWLEEYKRYIKEKKLNKNKTVMQIKYEKLVAKRLEMMVKREELMKKKQEKMLMAKMMKNPNMHPGFYYPKSKKTQPILNAIYNYKKDWEELDKLESMYVKEAFVKELQLDDYAGRDKELMMIGIVKQYTKIKLEDFLGDPNFAGEDLRCLYIPPNRLNGDMRYMWWNCCRKVNNGFYKRLLIGPRGSGKTRLTQVLASVNDAMIFELDPLQVQCDLLSPVYLQRIVKAVVSCAKALQPSVIHIKNIQKLFYSKIPKEEKELNLDLIKRYVIKKLLKQFHRTDKTTIIGSCEEPWVTNSKQLLKRFPSVYLLPNTSYSTTLQLLNNWILMNPTIPKDLDVSSLAYTLQGYSYGYLEKCLQSILTPERIIRIAAYGLSTEDLYDLIVGDQEEARPDYEKYLIWYTEKSTWGVKEKQHLEEQREFKRTLEIFAEKAKKKRPISVPSSNSSSKTDNLNRV